jgi:hypothetical protein
VIRDVNARTGSEAETFLKPGARCCVEELLVHLNANPLYYSRAVWLAEDANQRALRFDAVRYREGRLLDYIENRPMAVLGDYVAFPRRREDDDEEKDGPVPESEERDIVLPTRGVFAEAKLGHCSSCEERDITRFWDWTESSCPEKAPEIAPVQASSRAQQTNVQPSAMPAPVVNIVNPPAAPDPGGMAAAMSLLATPEIFRDMSARQEVAALLQELASGTISLEQASNRARQVQNRSGSGGGTGGRPGAREQFDQLKVYEKAPLAQEERSALAKDYLENAQYRPAQYLADEPLPYPGASMLPAEASVALFRNRTGSGRLGLDRAVVADRLRDLVLDPNLLKQGVLNLCGPAAFFRMVLAVDSLMFTEYAISLYEHGHAKIGDLRVTPEEEFLNYDYQSVLLPRMQEAGGDYFVCPATDWMTMAALRDVSNWFFDFERRSK